ncbi:MAG: hypothetical protein WBM13_12575 [Bacteroidia bacterium]
MADLKLQIQLIPFNNWGKNLRHYIPQKWKKIREEQLKIAHNQCAICGDSESKLHCHEQWDIDHKKLTQRLIGVQIVCESCHHCIHWGNTERIDTNGVLKKKIIEHFLKVNNCNEEVFKHHYNEVWKININSWKNSYQYELDLGEYVSEEEELKGEFKRDVSVFKKWLKNGHIHKEFMNFKPYIKCFENEMLNLFIKSVEQKNGQFVVLYLLQENKQHKLSKKFREAIKLKKFWVKYLLDFDIQI